MVCLFAYPRFRDVLVEAALQAGLVPALLSRLDWRQADSGGGGTVAKNREDGSRWEAGGGGEQRGASVARVLAVSVLRLLAAEGTHSPQVTGTPFRLLIRFGIIDRCGTIDDHNAKGLCSARCTRHLFGLCTGGLHLQFYNFSLTQATYWFVLLVHPMVAHVIKRVRLLVDTSESRFAIRIGQQTLHFFSLLSIFYSVLNLHINDTLPSY